jgi:DNA-binding Lrp family transcriptional regulator
VTETAGVSELDKKVIRALQGEFPLVAEPYKEMAEAIGISEELFLERVQALEAQKKIRKMGAVLRHREVGFKANVLVAWVVPQERLDEVALQMASHPAVTHCYDRTTAPGWPYNLYTMVHGRSREECEAIARELGEENGVTERTMLYSKREWKKTSMKYFCE